MDNFTILNQEALEKAKISKYGSKPENRSIDDYLRLGIIILDKLAGPTSHEVVSIVKEIFDMKKAGHAGTLDPGVTGVLPIALEGATKILGNLSNSKKEYICNMQITETVDEELIIKTMNLFEDEIYQVPPLKSNVVKKLRTRIIYELEFLEKIDNQVLFRVECQAGTYIRTLCEDLGKAIGTKAFMKELRRTKTGLFSENNVVTLHNLFDAFSEFKETNNEELVRKYVHPVEIMIVDFPKIIVKDQAIDPVCHGSQLNIPGVLGYTSFFANQEVALVSSKGELISIAETHISANSLISNDKGVVASPKSVFMTRGTYPKILFRRLDQFVIVG